MNVVEITELRMTHARIGLEGSEFVLWREQLLATQADTWTMESRRSKGFVCTFRSKQYTQGICAEPIWGLRKWKLPKMN